MGSDAALWERLGENAYTDMMVWRPVLVRLPRGELRRDRTGVTVASRRTLDETRTVILDAGVELLAESDYVMSPSALSMMDACRHAGLSTAGSAYKIWPTQEEFRFDVARHLIETDTDLMLREGHLVDVVNSPGETPTLQQLIRIVTNENAASTIGSPEFSRAVTVWWAAATDPQFESIFVAERKSRTDHLVELYEVVLDVYELEMRPPFTMAMMASSIQAQLTGLAMIGRFLPSPGLEDVERPTGRNGEMERWHLFGCAAEAIVEAYTQPRSAQSN